MLVKFKAMLDGGVEGETVIQSSLVTNIRQLGEHVAIYCTGSVVHVTDTFDTVQRVLQAAEGMAEQRGDISWLPDSRFMVPWQKPEGEVQP